MIWFHDRHVAILLTLILEWDNFVRITINRWEQFYMHWLTKGNNIMMVYYEKLKTCQLESTLKDIALFMNHDIEPNRLKCVMKHLPDFKKTDKCIFMSKRMKYRKQIKSKYFDYFETKNIYTRQHIIWINSAIRAVSKKAESRGFDSQHLLSYQNTNRKVKYCSL